MNLVINKNVTINVITKVMRDNIILLTILSFFIIIQFISIVNSKMI